MRGKAFNTLSSVRKQNAQPVQASFGGLSAHLGPRVEQRAQQCSGTLPALFSASGKTGATHCGQVRIWDEWESVLDLNQSGRIPSHVVVTSAYDPKSKRAHYALVCRSDVKLTLGSIGYLDLTQCFTVSNHLSFDHPRGAHLLEKHLPLMSARAPSGKFRTVGFEATPVGHCYVKLKNPRTLTPTQLAGLRNYQPGDDWLRLVKQLRT